MLKGGENMLKIKIAELFTQAMLYVSGFFATCLQNQNYIAVLAALLGFCLVGAAIGRAISAIAHSKR